MEGKSLVTAYDSLAVKALAASIEVAPELIREALSSKYKKRRIPKNSGGFRLIYIPEKKLKEIQRRVLRCFLPEFTMLDFNENCPAGICRGSSCLGHAISHRNANYVLKLDLSDAFPSTPVMAIKNILVEEFQITNPAKCLLSMERCQVVGRDSAYERFCVAVAELVIKLTTCNEILPQGAPTSPWLFGLVAGRMLASIREVLPFGWQATMYVDNIVISGPGPILPKTENAVENIVKSFGFRLNRQKRKQARTAAGCLITGLSVKKEGTRGRVCIPKKKRKQMRAILYQARNDPLLWEKARGLMAYAWSVYGPVEFFPKDIRIPCELLIAQL